MPAGSTWLSLVRASALGWIPLSDRQLPNIETLGINLVPQQSEGATQLTQNERICINISGRLFHIYKSMLDRYPDTLLGSSEKEYFYDSNTDEYFLDRDPGINLINYYFININSAIFIFIKFLNKERRNFYLSSPVSYPNFYFSAVFLRKSYFDIFWHSTGLGSYIFRRVNVWLHF